MWLLYAAFMAVSALAAISIERLLFDIGGSTAEPAKPAMVLARATADDGITANPALSSDGALLAYASDRAGMDNLDIWVQQTAGSAPIQLTHEAVDEIEPAFSPEGSRLAYRSERDGGGIYIVPTFGGQEPRLLVPGGRRPRFSPDGRLIAYWTGTKVGFANSSGSYRTFVIPAGGGAAREIGGFTGARNPVWSPDGQSLLLLGSRDPRPSRQTYEWWHAPLDGAAPIPVRANELLRRAGIAFDSGNIARPGRLARRSCLALGQHVSVVCAARFRYDHGIERGPPDIWHQPRIPGYDGRVGTHRLLQRFRDQQRVGATDRSRPRRRDGRATTADRRRRLRRTPFGNSRWPTRGLSHPIPRPSILIRNLKTQSIIDVGVPGPGSGPRSHRTERRWPTKTVAVSKSFPREAVHRARSASHVKSGIGRLTAGRWLS